MVKKTFISIMINLKKKKLRFYHVNTVHVVSSKNADIKICHKSPALHLLLRWWIVCQTLNSIDDEPPVACNL